MTRRPRVLIALALLLALAGPEPVRPQPAAPDGVALLLKRLEQTVLGGDVRGFLALTAGDATRARGFAQFQMLPGATRAVLRERDREPLPGTLPGDGYRLIVDLFAAYGDRARVVTWRLDVCRVGDDWRLADQEQLAATENLYRLQLNPATQYDAHDLLIEAEDVELRLASGSVFVAEVDQGVTGIVLLGKGHMRFRPRPETEKGQVRIFCGADELDTGFDAAFIRINPAEFASRLQAEQLNPRPVDPAEFRRAGAVFREEMPNSFNLDLGDLSSDVWSLLPPFGDFLAEVRTKRFATLTYARAAAEPEDITLFDRRHRHNIALYASREKLAARGRFFNEDDLADYEVSTYDLDLSFAPDRLWIEGRALLRVRVKAPTLNALSLKLADSLVVRSVVAGGLGRLFAIRVRNQNTVIVNLPAALHQGSQLLVAVSYQGRLEPQPVDQERVQVGRAPSLPDLPPVAAEASFLYSNRSYWYPQAETSNYATAKIRITVPAEFGCVASGDLDVGFPARAAQAPADPAHAPRVYAFTATQPVRYLSFVVSRFVRVKPVTVPLRAAGAGDGAGGDPALPGVSYDALTVDGAAPARDLERARQLVDRAAAIARFYASLLGDYPYPSFTIALVEHDLPGGHSPAYFTALRHPLPTSPFVWRNDPTAFQDFPDFFVAHELAHQWWGQAVGWRNYHEQWLSEGFAQYFAALYARQQRGDGAFNDIMRQLRRWSIDESSQGPVYLGYRLGHIRNDGRVFRALVYDKGAAVLQMLRLLVGDDAFFGGLRRFYREARFTKVGTEDFRAAMERASGRPLERFFDRWIYSAAIPRLKFGYRVESGPSGEEVALHVEQLGEIFDVPVPVTLIYADAKRTDLVVPATDRVVEMRVPLTGRLRTVEVRDDAGMLAQVVR